MIEPARLLTLAEEMAARAGEDESYSALAVLASHGALEALVNRLGGEVIASFNYRARFLPKWHESMLSHDPSVGDLVCHGSSPDRHRHPVPPSSSKLRTSATSLRASSSR
jgi:hypothetical protein